MPFQSGLARCIPPYKTPPSFAPGKVPIPEMLSEQDGEPLALCRRVGPKGRCQQHVLDPYGTCGARGTTEEPGEEALRALLRRCLRLTRHDLCGFLAPWQDHFFPCIPSTVVLCHYLARHIRSLESCIEELDWPGHSSRE